MVGILYCLTRIQCTRYFGAASLIVFGLLMVSIRGDVKMVQRYNIQRVTILKSIIDTNIRKITLSTIIIIIHLKTNSVPTPRPSYKKIVPYEIRC
jgi:hypothetical protein